MCGRFTLTATIEEIIDWRQMEIYAVSSLVNSPANNSIEPIQKIG